MKQKGRDRQVKKDDKQDSGQPMPDQKTEKVMQNIIRLGETNLDGNKPVRDAILQIKGVSFSLSNAISKVSPFADRKVGDLSEEEIKKLDDMINNPQNYNIPSWMYNRRKDFETGEDKHLAVSRLELTQKMDIGREKKLRSYRGIRHMAGLPVRGQRTRGSFRTGGTLGVSRKKAKEAKKSQL